MRAWVFLIWCLLLLFIFASARKTRRRAAIVKKHLKNKRTKEEGELLYMLSLINQFIGKKCDIQTVGQDYTGVIESVEESWIIVKDSFYDTREIINLEYVTSIRQCKEKVKKSKTAKESAE